MPRSSIAPDAYQSKNTSPWQLLLRRIWTASWKNKLRRILISPDGLWLSCTVRNVPNTRSVTVMHSTEMFQTRGRWLSCTVRKCSKQAVGDCHAQYGNVPNRRSVTVMHSTEMSQTGGRSLSCTVQKCSKHAVGDCHVPNSLFPTDMIQNSFGAHKLNGVAWHVGHYTLNRSSMTCGPLYAK